MHSRAAGEVFQGKALSRSFPPWCESSQRGMKREHGGAGQQEQARDKEVFNFII